MTSLSSPADLVDLTAEQARTNPPRKRVAPPLLMGDILTSQQGVPTLLAHWFAARDAHDSED